MTKFVVRPSNLEALRQEFLNDILRRIEWLSAGSGARRVKEQAAVQAAINELNLLLKFWQGVVIEPMPASRKRIRVRSRNPEELAK